LVSILKFKIKRRVQSIEVDERIYSLEEVIEHLFDLMSRVFGEDLVSYEVEVLEE